MISAIASEEFMYKKALLLFSAILISATTTLGLPAAPQVPQVLTEHNMAMKTRDGVILRADIYRPLGDGLFPVLLQRTPYDKNYIAAFAQRAVARGYMVVVQDVRGRYASEGDFYTFKHETNDGYDTIEWAAALPHSNGKVGMFGGSYVGATQMLAAIGHPPHLAGICPVVTASNYHENWTYQGGAFEQWFDESWTSSLAQNTLSRVAHNHANALLGDSVPLKQFPVLNLESPVDGAALTRTLAPYFLDWVDHPLYDSYWKQWSIEEQYASIQVPALTIAAWYDIFQGGSLRNFTGMQAHAGNEAARKGQRLLVTIGGHAGYGRKIGELDFGPAAAEYDEDGVTLDWYDYLFQGKQNQFASDKPVHIFVMGENKWRDEAAWPLPEAKGTPFLLSSDKNANSSAGDGQLLGTAKGKITGKDTFTYDPANPVPTVGGPLCCDAAHLAPGPRDQKEVEARPDVLVYSTDTLDKDVEVTGPVTLDLFASSSAVDTDFTAKLVDVWPNGFVQNLTEGILRASFRNSTSKAEPIVPGQIYKYKIDLWSTSNVFLKGHKIRLEVSSSNFPRFDRNLNTGKSAADSSDFTKAVNTVYHDAAHPSALVLPIVPR
jgi:putative CocE/NonD family hydrolase